MLKNVNRIAAFSLAWVFAISMLSNCYCAPTSEAAKTASPAAAHCKHHPQVPEKDSDCAPRYQTDQFENFSSALKIIETPVASSLNVVGGVLFQEDSTSSFLKRIESPPVSPPDFFVLHHSFLI